MAANPPERPSRVAGALSSAARRARDRAPARAYQERPVPAGARWALSVLASLGEWAAATLDAWRRQAPAGPPPACVPDGPPVVVKGTVLPGDDRTRLMVPFGVQPGTLRLEVGYRWRELPPSLPDNPLTRTVLDLGLWDEHGYRSADGFRGWSGSRHDHVFVEAGVAQRGYRPGPIGPGTWHVDLGVGAVGPTGAEWELTVQARSQGAGPPAAPPPDPVDPAHVARAGPGWYHGDFHLHAWHSHPRGPEPAEAVRLARAAGLDFVPITEYVVGHHWDEYGAVQRANPDLVVWPGREIVTYSGHVQSLGETPGFVEFRHGFEDVRIGDMQRAVRQAGALFQVNHPTTFPGPLFRNLCRGCEFELGDEIDWDAVDTIEVLTGDALVDPSEYQLPDLGVRVPNPFMPSAVVLWERLLDEGHRITAVCGSDDKLGSRYGTCATAVFATQLSRAGIVEALRAGRAYVRTRGVAASPALELVATAAAQPDGTFGSVLVLDGPGTQAELRVTVTGGDGQVLRLVGSGGHAAGTVAVRGDAFEHAFRVGRRPGEGPLGTWYRLETADEQGLTTIGNPVFLRGPVAGP